MHHLQTSSKSLSCYCSRSIPLALLCLTLASPLGWMPRALAQEGVSQEGAPTVQEEPIPEGRVSPPGEPAPEGAADTAPQPEGASPTTEVLQARMAGPPGHRAVREVSLFRQDAGRLAFSRQGDYLAYDKKGEDGRYDVHLLRTNGASERCLTCDIYDFRRTNVLDPVWHPSGEYLVVQVQESPRRLKLDPLRMATPLRGVHSELWVVLAKGRQAWRITRTSEQGGAVLGPAFSYEGDRLLWNERLSNVDDPWGHWGARVAELSIRRGLPKLGKITTHDGGWKPGFSIASGFTPDDRGLLMAASPDDGQPTSGRDVLRLDLESGAAERLLVTPDQWDDRLTAAPRGDALVFVSNRGLDRQRKLPYRGDLWLLVPRQQRIERLTYFNDAKSPYDLGEALIDDIAWDPKQPQILVHVVWAIPGADAAFDKEVPRVEEAIYRIALQDSFPD